MVTLNDNATRLAMQAFTWTREHEIDDARETLQRVARMLTDANPSEPMHAAQWSGDQMLDAAAALKVWHVLDAHLAAGATLPEMAASLQRELLSESRYVRRSTNQVSNLAEQSLNAARANVLQKLDEIVTFAVRQDEAQQLAARTSYRYDVVIVRHAHQVGEGKEMAKAESCVATFALKADAEADCKKRNRRLAAESKARGWRNEVKEVVTVAPEPTAQAAEGGAL